jgi:hypothetical protein
MAELAALQDTAPFILRYEDGIRVSELQVAEMDLREDILDTWDRLLWRCLTPSTYERIKKACCVKLWRRPRWVEHHVVPHLGQSARRKLRGVLQMLRRGDILWVCP